VRRLDAALVRYSKTEAGVLINRKAVSSRRTPKVLFPTVDVHTNSIRTQRRMRTC
jgi:hypothetical protein